jgi:hypothetical protein
MKMSDNIYYLYVLLDPRKSGLFKYDDLEFNYEPFYVGISKHKNRYLSHLGEAYRLNINSNKCNKIRQIKMETRMDPISINLLDKLSRYEACNLEIKYIKKIGRSNLKNGPLTNMTNGGEGISGFEMSEIANENNRKRTKLLWKNENYRNKQIKSHKDSYKNNPDLGKKDSEILVNLWKNENYRNKQIKSHKDFIENNPSSAIKIVEESRERIKKLWEREDFKNKQLIGVLKRSRWWIITYPDGHEETIKNLAKFCRENKLNTGSMCWVGKGLKKHHKKFKCRKLED